MTSPIESLDASRPGGFQREFARIMDGQPEGLRADKRAKTPLQALVQIEVIIEAVREAQQATAQSVPAAEIPIPQQAAAKVLQLTS